MKRKSTAEKTDSRRILQARAFAPGHITGFFAIDDADPDPLRRGSRGAGVSIAAGAVTAVHLSPAAAPSLAVGLNDDRQAEAPVSRRTVELFSEATGGTPYAVAVDHLISVPQGAGFGSSGAGALSLALALNAACGAPLSEDEAARIAHRAELDCRTGLGTVLACTTGGLEIRTRAGAPGSGEVRPFAVPDGFIVLCLVYGPLSTRSALADANLRRKINDAGAALGKRLLAEPTVPRFLRLSREFTEAVGLVTPRLRRLLGGLDRRGIIAAMTMFGEAVFTVIEEAGRPGLEEICGRARAEGARIFESRIAREGGAVIHDA